jgi:hypothetical protein
MKIPNTIDKKCIKKHDLEVFKMLIRALKEIGILHKFKSQEAIIKRCYWSRNYYGSMSNEPLYQNMALWVGDIQALFDKKFKLTSEQNALLRLKYQYLVLSNVLLKNKIYSRNFMGCFFETIKYCNDNKIFDNKKNITHGLKETIEKCSNHLKHFIAQGPKAYQVDKIIEKWQ